MDIFFPFALKLAFYHYYINQRPSPGNSPSQGRMNTMAAFPIAETNNFACIDEKDR
jgi:hypothetical protein